MENSIGAIERKIMVCVRNDCFQCTPLVTTVPKECKYDVLHSLEPELGIREKPRQSGKTTELVALANELYLRGYLVYFVTRTHDMGRHIKSNYLAGNTMNDGIKMISLGEIKQRNMRGMAPGYIVADEIHPEEAAMIQAVMVGSRMVAGYYTPLS